MQSAPFKKMVIIRLLVTLLWSTSRTEKFKNARYTIRSKTDLTTFLWNLVDSNHILRIFSPAHTPCLPKFLCHKGN